MEKKDKIKMIKNQIKFRKFMNKKWGSFLESDPAYNPNLELNEGDFKLSQTPRTLPLSEI